MVLEQQMVRSKIMGKTSFPSFLLSFFRKFYKGERITLDLMTTDLDNVISKLPISGKRIFLKGYSKLKDSGLSDKECLRGSLDLVSNNYTNLGDSWALRQDITLNTAIIKEGGFFNPQFFFDATLSSDNKDDQGQYADLQLLQNLSEKNLISSLGDVFHFENKGFLGWKGLFKKGDHRIEGNKLKIRFNIDTKHDKFKQFMKLNKQYDFSKLSAEFYNPVLMGKRIVGASGLGWTLLPKGSNPDAKIEKIIKYN